MDVEFLGRALLGLVAAGLIGFSLLDWNRSRGAPARARIAANLALGLAFAAGAVIVYGLLR